MKSSAKYLYVLVCPILFIAATFARPASAQNIVEQRNIINWGTWNWDNYSNHILLDLDPGLPDGSYYLHFTAGNGASSFNAPFQIIAGQSSPPVLDFGGTPAIYVPDGGTIMAAVSVFGVGPGTVGISVPASGENTVWRSDSYYEHAEDVPPAVHYDFTFNVYVGASTPTATPSCYHKCNDDKSGGNQETCPGCNNAGMARYSVHSMLVSLNIQDTPLRYTPPRGPAIDFTVTYNQKEEQQPAVFSYSNLGPKWTFSWLSYVVDNPVAQLTSTAVYLPEGGTEIYPFDSVSQTFAPDPQSHAVLVRTGPDTYEKKFPDGSKQIFNLTSGVTTYPRKIFMTQMIDATGNSASIGYDDRRRITTITDALGQITTVSYGLATDPLKITRVTDPFGRFATFQYENGKLKTVTDEIGIQSHFTYQSATNSIDSLTTPYGTTSFVFGESGTNRWIEINDPINGKERVEYRDNAPGIGTSDSVAPNAAGMVNSGLETANTFYWDKKAMAVAPGDYTKAKIKHWLHDANGSVSGIISSEKQPLENRVWYTYSGQPDSQHVGSIAKPSQVARVLADGTTQLSHYEYNSIGKTTRSVDSAGRSVTYVYDANQIDLLETRQTTGTCNELLRRITYNASHQPLTETDAAGQVTTFVYNGFGQILTRTNAKGETTTYAYGGTVPSGYLASIMSPPIDRVAAVTIFGYDSYGRVHTVTDETDHYTVTTDYDNLDRKVQVTYPDTTYEQFQYTDNITGLMTLDLTRSRDRLGRWTYRHYNGDRKMDSITDPLFRTTLYGWCTCGSLTSITDPNGNVTTFNRDLQSRVYQKIFADRSTIDYLFEGQTAPGTVGATSRLQSSTDALHRRTNFSYSIDNNLSQVTYTDLSGNPLDPPTASVGYTYDPNYDRIATMADQTGVTTYSFYPVNSSPGLGAGKLESINGPLPNDTVSFTYDKIGRMVSRSIEGTVETVAYDALGRLTTTDNALGHFDRQYEKVTQRLRTVIYPNGQKTINNYYGNEHDRRLRTLQNVSSNGTNLSKFDYDYNAEGQVVSLGKLLETTASGLWFDYDDAQQLVGARNTSEPSLASHRCDYAYDGAGNRISDSDYDPRPVPIGGWLNGIFASYSSNALNQLDTRTVQTNNEAPVRSELIYDSVGNLRDDGAGTTFDWDAANRLIAIHYQDESRTEFTYDGLNRRVRVVEKTASTTTSATKFVWVGNKIVQERDETDVILREYFNEGEQRRITRGDHAQYYYTRDQLGSIRELTKANGPVQVRYDYDPFGKPTKLSEKWDLDFGYTGHFYHPRSGLDLTLYRAYNPELGRWLSRDPIEERGGLNLYGYVENNPVNAIDPLGLIRIYGNWCGPDWTGGRKEAYAPHPPGYYRAPVNELDSACEKHDGCYFQCRNDHPCDGEMRSECFRECDRPLTTAANAFGGFWGRTIALAIDRPGKRSPERDNPSCCQKVK